jgi:hypothetical protein
MMGEVTVTIQATGVTTAIDIAKKDQLADVQGERPGQVMEVVERLVAKAREAVAGALGVQVTPDKKARGMSKAHLLEEIKRIGKEGNSHRMEMWVTRNYLLSYIDDNDIVMAIADLPGGKAKPAEGGG